MWNVPFTLPPLETYLVNLYSFLLLSIKYQPLLRENEIYLRQSRARKSHSLLQIAQLVVFSSVLEVAYIIIGRDVPRPEDGGVDLCLVVQSWTGDYTLFDAEGGAVGAEERGCGESGDECSGGKVATGRCSL